MSGARSRKIWTVDEDALLRSLVERYGEARGSQSKWKIVADKIPGRTTKDCRKRWFHSLDPNVRKGRWTAEEDQILKQAYQELGPAWHIIANMIRGRKDDQCAKRYNEILDPSASNRLRQWTTQEDEILCDGVRELGNQWSVLAQRLPGRPPLTCRNRWRALSRYSGGSATAASSPRRSSRETPQSEMTTPQNINTPQIIDDDVFNTSDTIHATDTAAGSSTDPTNIFSATRELEGLDEWWDNSFLIGTSPWLEANGALNSPRRQQSQPLLTPQPTQIQQPQQSTQTRHSERLQNRQNGTSTSVQHIPEATHPQTGNLNNENADRRVQNKIPSDNVNTQTGTSSHLDPNQRTIVVEFDTGGIASTSGQPSMPAAPSSADSSTDSSAEGISSLPFTFDLADIQSERPIPDQQPLPPPGLQLQYNQSAAEPIVESQSDDNAPNQRQRPILQAEQIAEIERTSRQMSASTVPGNGAQHIFHHYHHHHHHYHHHYYHNEGQTR